MMFWTILQILLIIIILGIGFRLWLSPPTRWCRSQRCLVGKTALVTGANSGIGYQTALDFAKRGAKVIIACRDKKKAHEARDRIIRESGNEQILIKIVDFSSFDSIRAFAEEINHGENRLDILVNNAGMAFGGGDKTVDGYTTLMQVNYYSHFLLTILLVNLMKKSSEASRIVNISSRAAEFVNFLDINHIDKYKGDIITYTNSKLCNILFTKELAKRLQGTQITTYSLHPGAIKTGIFQNCEGFTKFLFHIVTALFYKNVEEGAQTTIYCCVEKNIEKFNGDHFDNCRRVSDYSTVKKPGLSRKLWELTAEIVKETLEERT